MHHSTGGVSYQGHADTISAGLRLDVRVPASCKDGIFYILKTRKLTHKYNDALAFYGFQNKSPPTEWLKTRPVDYVTVLEVGSPTQVPRAGSFWRPQGTIWFPAFSSFQAPAFLAWAHGPSPTFKAGGLRSLPLFQSHVSL